MLKSYLSYIGVAVVLLSATMQSCKKTDGVDNNQVIETPYSLYYSDSSAALYNTNDGTNIKPLVMTPDGFPPNAICASGSNLLFSKSKDLEVSINNGVNFNPTYQFCNLIGIPQTGICNVADQNRIFVAATSGRMGVFYSDKNGAPSSFVEDANYDVNLNGSISITSLTELQNKTLIGYDAVNNRSFMRSNKADVWHETTGGTPLPSGGVFSISHLTNIVVAVDATGANGAYYSTDNGNTWAAYSGLPNVPILSVNAPFDEVLLVGTKSSGIYRLVGNIFVPANNGLARYAVVNGIVGKENIYKNVTTPKQYVYIATNQGLFVSQDLGQNWDLAQKGNIVAIY